MATNEKRPAVSLTDEQYEEIFDAVLASLSPQLSNSKDDFDAVLDEDSNFEAGSAGKKMAEIPKGSEIGDEEPQAEDVNMGEEDEGKEVVEGSDDDDEEEAMNEARQEQDESDSPSEASVSAAQQVNEITPEVSEIGSPLPSLQLKHKLAKKQSSAKKARKQAMPPKHLDFPKKSKAGPRKEQPHVKESKKRKLSKKEKMLERIDDLEVEGVWVQCVNRACQKWRYLAEINDPSVLPEKWTCSMNDDTSYNSCSTPQQEFDQDVHDEDYVFTKYTEGSIVWAKVAGFPLWPAFVEADPDTQTYFECQGFSNTATHFHVVFFDEKVSRIWVKVTSLKPFTGKEFLGEVGPTKIRNHDYKKELLRAQAKANAALELPLKDRLKEYSFSKRYRGHWAKDDTDSSQRSEAGIQVSSVRKKLAPPPQSDNSQHYEEVDKFLEAAEDIIKDAEKILDSMDEELFSQEPESDYEPDPEAEKKKKKKKKGEKENGEKKVDKLFEKIKKKKKEKKRDCEKKKQKKGADHMKVTKENKIVKTGEKKEPHIPTTKVKHEVKTKPSFSAPKVSKPSKSPGKAEVKSEADASKVIIAEEGICVELPAETAKVPAVAGVDPPLETELCSLAKRNIQAFDADVFTMELSMQQEESVDQDKKMECCPKLEQNKISPKEEKKKLQEERSEQGNTEQSMDCTKPREIAKLLKKKPKFAAPVSKSAGKPLKLGLAAPKSKAGKTGLHKDDPAATSSKSNEDKTKPAESLPRESPKNDEDSQQPAKKSKKTLGLGKKKGKGKAEDLKPTLKSVKRKILTSDESDEKKMRVSKDEDTEEVCHDTAKPKHVGPAEEVCHDTAKPKHVGPAEEVCHDTAKPRRVGPAEEVYHDTAKPKHVGPAEEVCHDTAKPKHVGPAEEVCHDTAKPRRVGPAEEVYHDTAKPKHVGPAEEVCHDTAKPKHVGPAEEVSERKEGKAEEEEASGQGLCSHTAVVEVTSTREVSVKVLKNSPLEEEDSQGMDFDAPLTQASNEVCVQDADDKSDDFDMDLDADPSACDARDASSAASGNIQDFDFGDDEKEDLSTDKKLTPVVKKSPLKSET